MGPAHDPVETVVFEIGKQEREFKLYVIRPCIFEKAERMALSSDSETEKLLDLLAPQNFKTHG